MERPESVRRVAPPIRIMATMRVAIAPSHSLSVRTWRAFIATSLLDPAMAAVEDMAGLIAARGRELNSGPLPHCRISPPSRRCQDVPSPPVGEGFPAAILRERRSAQVALAGRVRGG